MGAKKRLEQRMMRKYDKQQRLASHMTELETCMMQAEEENLPSAVGLRAVYSILQEILP